MFFLSGVIRTLGQGLRFSRKTVSVVAESALGTVLFLSDTDRQWCPHSTDLPWHRTAVT